MYKMGKDSLKLNVGGVLIFLVLIRPFINFLYDVELASIFGYSFNPLALWGAIVILICFFYWIIQKEKILRYNITLWVFVFIFSLIPGLMLAEGILPIITQFIKILPWALSIPVFVDYFLHYNYRKIFSKFYVIIIILLVLNILLLIMGIYSTGRYGLGEFYSLQKNPHEFAYTILFLIPFLINRAYIDKRRIIPLIFLIIASFLLFFSFVRTGIVAFLIGLFVLLFLEKKFYKKFRLLFFILSFLLIFLVLISNIDFLNYAFEERTKDIRDSLLIGEYSNLGSGRWDIWKTQLNFYFGSTIFEIIFGHGFGTDIALFGNVGHNDYISLLISGGLISLIFFILLQYKLLKYSILVYKYKNATIGKIGILTLVIFYIAGFLNGTIYYQSSIYVAIIIGAVIAEKYKKKE